MNKMHLILTLINMENMGRLKSIDVCKELEIK